MVKEVIAIDLGGTNLRIALVKKNKIITYIKKKTPKSKKLLLKEITESVDQLMNKNIKGIGVSSAGPLINGIIKNPPHLPLKNFDLKGFLRKKYRKKVIVENDANCVAIAEQRMGCKKKNFFILTLGTGIGGGLIINGKLYTGRGYASEPGHIIMQDGKDFETLWKEKSKLVKKHFGEKLTIKEMLSKKDKFSKKTIEDIIEVVAKGIGSLIDVFDPEIVILNGGIKETGEHFLKPLRKKTRKYVLIPRMPEIKWSEIRHPNIRGANFLIE